jgi:hypothetical protein
MAFAQELHSIKSLFAQREWAMHEPADFVDTLPHDEGRVAAPVQALTGSRRQALQLSLSRSPARV